ncbi:unnamed protein product [Schistosoma margrebowiei]|uniref:Uncharacterized protein n=1 Tax=Schistosoma margrebowiei TaxID=48269 RepID=A0A183N7U9_9TREM|nr:unnamed protein product [Schistosoma margrebowiei]
MTKPSSSENKTPKAVSLHVVNASSNVNFNRYLTTLLRITRFRKTAFYAQNIRSIERVHQQLKITLDGPSLSQGANGVRSAVEADVRHTATRLQSDTLISRIINGSFIFNEYGSKFQQQPRHPPT